MKNLKLGFLALGLVYMPSVVQAGFFGPSDYDECVLEGIKDAKTETASRMVAQACRNKFPLRSEQAKHPVTVWFDFYDRNTGSFGGLSNKLSIVSKKPWGDNEQLRIMNNYTFGVTRVAVGVIKKGRKGDKCPDKFSDYKEVVNCAGYAGARQSGNFDCSAINGSYCITGFEGDFGDRTEKDVNTIIKKEIHPLK